MWLAWCGAQARQYLPPVSPKDAQAQPGARKVTVEAGSGWNLVPSWSTRVPSNLNMPFKAQSLELGVASFTSVKGLHSRTIVLLANQGMGILEGHL